MKYLIDTNIFIYFFNNDKIIVEYFNSIKENQEEIFYSFITKIELMGFRDITKQIKSEIQSVLNEFIKIDFNDTIEKKIIEIREKKKIKIPDAIIAASAIVNELTLVTHNSKDFKNIEKLIIFNPFKNLK